MQKINSAAKASINWSFLFLTVFLIAIYTPLIMHGGIIVDDWGDIAHNLDCSGFVHCYQTWFPLFSNRPLAPLPITVATFLFGTFFSGYLILNTAIYLLAILITRKVIAQYIGNGPSIVFAILAAVPFIAMPVIASPINQLTATVSFFLWALSLQSLNHFLDSKSNTAYFLTYIYLLLAFLTYEVILPLLVFTALLPLLSTIELNRKNWLQYFLKFILPIGAVLGVIVLWQKGIAPMYMEVDSRLKLNPAQMLAKLHTWVHVFYAQIPSLFLKSAAYISLEKILALSFCLSAIWFGMFGISAQPLKSSILRFWMVSAACFVASSSIFILSNESANSWGYQARGLSSTWFALSLFIASFSAFPFFRKILFLFIASFAVLSSASFEIQRDNYITSWRIQKLILSDALGLIRENISSKNAIVIGDVPKFVNPNYNDEIIFSQPWDFGGALAIFSNGAVKDGAVIDSQRKDFNRLEISENQIIINGWWKTNTENLWLYEFDPISQKGSISRIKSLDQFKEKLNSWGYQKISNKYAPINQV